MGQYHLVLNKTKKEFIHAHKLNSGLKLCEQIGYFKSPSTALFLLLANSNGRGGGDVNDHSYVGRWAGDEIVVQGDYADELCQGYAATDLDWVDISENVKGMLDSCITWEK
jgi:hypothetical protein